MKQIIYDIDDRFYQYLSVLKNKLEKKENLKISFSNMIEEALLSHYKISIADFIKPDDVYYIESIDITTKYIVYAFLDLSKKVKLDTGIYKFDYEPFFIGTNQQYREIANLDNKNNILNNKINELKKQNDFGIKILFENLNKGESFSIAKKLIKCIGRIDKAEGTLLNKNNGNVRIKTSEKSELNLEKNIGVLLVNALNRYKSIKKTAEHLNISQRTLFRKIKFYSIKKNKKTNNYYCNN